MYGDSCAGIVTDVTGGACFVFFACAVTRRAIILEDGVSTSGFNLTRSRAIYVATFGDDSTQIIIINMPKGYHIIKIFNRTPRL